MFVLGLILVVKCMPGERCGQFALQWWWSLLSVLVEELEEEDGTLDRVEEQLPRPESLKLDAEQEFEGELLCSIDLSSCWSSRPEYVNVEETKDSWESSMMTKLSTCESHAITRSKNLDKKRGSRRNLWQRSRFYIESSCLLILFLLREFYKNTLDALRCMMSHEEMQ